MQLCVAPEADGAGEPDAVRDDEPAAAHFFQFVEGLGESFSAQSDAVSYCTEVSESNRVEGNFWGVYAGHFEGKTFVEVVQTFVFLAAGKDGQKA